MSSQNERHKRMNHYKQAAQALHQAVISTISGLMDADHAPESAAAQALSALANAVAAYESFLFPAGAALHDMVGNSAGIKVCAKCGVGELNSRRRACEVATEP